MRSSGIFISCVDLLLLSVSLCPVSSNFFATEKPASLTVVEGGTAIFHCHINQQMRESYDIAWFSENRNAFLSKNPSLRHPDADVRSRYSITRTYGHRFDLKIENVKTSDAGRFSCMYAYQDTPLQKSYYTNVGSAAELTVWTAPVVGSPACHLNTLPSGDVEFECVSEGGNPTPSLHLYADGIRQLSKPEVNGRNIYISITLNEAYRGVNLQCTLESKALQSPRTCSLTPLPPVVRITPKRGKVMEDGEIQFNCSSHGLNNPIYEWMATPKLILKKRFSSDAELVTLTIREARLADNGSKLMCVATGENGDKVASEEAILMVEKRIEPIVTEVATHIRTTIDPNATDLLMPVNPRAKHNVIDFFQNNVLILAVCVAGLFIALLSMVAIVIVCRRKRKSYDVADKLDDEVMVNTTVYTSYEKFDQRKITNANLVSETNKMTDETKQALVNGSPSVSPAESPTRSQPTSPKESPKLSSKNSPSQTLEQSPCTTSTTKGPHYAKPMKGAKCNQNHPPPAYAMPMKREFHLSLEDVTGNNLPKDSPDSNNQKNHKNEYAELTHVISPTTNNIKGNKYEEIIPSPPPPATDPRQLNVEGLKYADLDINKQCSSEIRSDLSMKTHYAELAKPNDAIGNN